MTSETSTDGGGSTADEVEVREFKQLEKDQPGGVVYREALTAEPTADELRDAAREVSSRSDAEHFAIVLNHALQDRTAGSAQDSARDLVAKDIPEDSQFFLDGLTEWPGSRVVPGSRSWLRSTEVSDTGSGSVARVQLVEQIEVPAMGDSPDEPFVYWHSFLITLRATDGEWQLADLQEAIASEYEEFSPYTWEGAMDSGKDWRRFDVG